MIFVELELGKKLLKKKTLKDIFGGDITPEKFEELPLFEIERLQIATNFFHESNQLGRGGFGSVYKVMAYSLTVYLIAIWFSLKFSLIIWAGEIRKWTRYCG